MAKGYEEKTVENSYVAPTDGFVVARVRGFAPDSRQAQADGYVDNTLVASASAADNFTHDVMSSAVQSFTMPVRKGSQWRVDGSGSGEVKVWWFAFA
jgi:hypothetical protein